MYLILFDDQYSDNLLPFTFTRPVADLRIGIITIREKWERLTGLTTGTVTRSYLQKKYPFGNNTNCLFINAALLPDERLVQWVNKLKPGQQLIEGDRLIMARFNEWKDSSIQQMQPLDNLETILYDGNLSFISNSWDLFLKNDQALRDDFLLLTKGKNSVKVSSTNQTIQPGQIFIEEGAKVEYSILNASTGPIYISAGAEVMEGCMIRGPFSLGEKAQLKMGARIYGATTIGPGAKVGGEISNSVIWGNSNKAHDGFLGNSVIGEWCNLGADTNNSNLKNNYGEVKVWNYIANDFINTRLQFCGLFMGDHSKCGINTMFNTGTTTGVFANIFGAGFPDKYIPSFYWGGAGGAETFLLDKALELAAAVYARRNKQFDDIDSAIITHLFMMNLKPVDGDQ